MIPLRRTAALLDVVNSWAFLPHVRLIEGKAVLVTLCNCYASAFCAARGAWLPPLKADEQAQWLMHSPDWERLGRADARARANAGRLVLAVAELEPHGHIAPLVESPPGGERVYVSAAGSHNFEAVVLESSFGFLTPVFYGHKEA